MSREQVQPGDLAVIVGGRCPANVGAFVRVGERIESYTLHYYRDVNGRPRPFVAENPVVYEVTTAGRPLVAHPGGDLFNTRPYNAARLRPIRNPPGQDETLRWADVPRNDFCDTGFVPLEG